MILTRGMSGGRLATGALLLFFATYGAGYLLFSGDQAWVFQRLVGSVAIALLVVVTFGRRVSHWTSRGIRSLDDWILRRSARAAVLLAVLIATYFVSWCGISFLRHYYFHSSYDLAIMDQIVWNTAQVVDKEKVGFSAK